MSDLTPKIITQDCGNGTTVATIEGAFQRNDGACRVNVFWEEEAEGEHAPGYWVAKLHDETHNAPSGITGTGDTHAEALADLCIALYVAFGPEDGAQP